MTAADIILPIAVEGVFTYLLPETSDISPQVGMRALVPLGARKVITGIIEAIHPLEEDQNPEDYKEIVCLLEDYPIVTAQQLRLWNWISEYYMCSLGDVMRAALPTAFKLESETRIHKNPDFIEEKLLSRACQAVWDLLDDKKPLTLHELAVKRNVKTIVPAVNQLLELNAVVVEEKVVEKYTPKKEKYVALINFEFADKNSEKWKSLTIKQQEIVDTIVKQGKKEVKLITLRSSSHGSLQGLASLLRKGVVVQYEKEVGRLDLSETETQAAHTLNAEQTRAAEEIRKSWEKTPVVLLHGVTSSGKTEVYIHLIQEQIQAGKKVLYLVPEIALTTQLTDRLRVVFGNRLGVYHSMFSDKERVEIYKNVLSGDQYDVIIGVRSSLFLPFKDLGLIIVDEEHDGSYKQQDPAPRYHARTTAIVLASFFVGKTLLGTATPAVETYFNAQAGKFGLVEMKERYAGLSLPAMHILDLQKAYKKKEVTGHFSEPLIFRIREQLAECKQVMLFQNRRGYNSFVECSSCGYVPKCVNCDISLTEHKSVRPDLPGRLVCHYCGYSIPTPPVCPECREGKFDDRGFGTEKIEEEARELFPEARVARMDSDTIGTKHAHERLIRKVDNHEVDILIGTQMITKGLHFKDVNLVAVMKADSLMNLPDFRSQERAFQLLEQVAGRAGRNDVLGHVILQTSDYTHPLFASLKKHDYKAMYAEQIRERKMFGYPPFHRIIAISMKHRDASRVETTARTLQERLKASFGSRCSDVVVPSVSRAHNAYIRNIILKIEAEAPYGKAKQILAQEMRYVQSLQTGKGVVMTADVDPM